MSTQNDLNSVIVDLSSNTTEVKKTSEIGLPTKFNLSVLRGQVVFTSAYILINKHGKRLFQIDNHFNRLERSYKVMFESQSLPFSRDDFQKYGDILIENNKETQSCPYYQVLILLLAGKSEIVGDGQESYRNGFGGNLAQVLLIANPMDIKADWTFDKGINIFSFPYQREIADAKPTLYLGGIQGDHILSAINTYYLCKALEKNHVSIKDLYSMYSNWPVQQQHSFRLIMHDLKNNRLKIESSLQTLYPHQEESLYTLVKSMLKRPTFLDEYKHFESKEVQCLLHEVVFTSPEYPHYILEGATFGIMGIDKQNQVRFIPLENKSSDTNKGKVLESTTIRLLKEIVTGCGYDYLETSVTYEEALNFNFLFALSATRIFSNEGIKCPPIQSIDGKVLPKSSKKSIEMTSKIFEKMKLFFENYTY
ncbi:hypothetical protein DID80_02080 [Candidatus Marinamargulisbacteria bacterium SCGC AAA071-K20]|nr:hypothetical protein DID80_02080 [Candidatus Marinamargulisbacteria bacterium SCGC AAA071-K20]